MKKQLALFATKEELKKVTDQLNTQAVKVEKNSGDIKTIFDLITHLQNSMGKHSARQEPSDDQLNPLRERLDKVESSLSSMRKLIDELRAYLNKSLESLRNNSAQPVSTPPKSALDTDELERI